MTKLNDDWLVSPFIQQRLLDESEDTGGNLTGFWAVVTGENGARKVMASTKIMPDPMQQVFAGDMAQALNRHLRHDGAWIVFWTHPPQVFGADHLYRMWHFLWIDRDGDPQFTIDNEDAFHTVLLEGADHWLESAEVAWQQWREMMIDVLDPKQKQLFKRAQGEAPPSINGVRV